MRTLGNIIWNFPFLGFVTAAIVFLIGLLFVVTIIAAPIGLGLIQYSKFLLLPFSYDMVSKSELEGEADKNILWQTYGFILKSVYIIFLGIPLAIVTLIQIIGCFCSVIGIPVAIQDGCIQIAFIIITVIANSRGLNDAAAVGIVEKVISALFIVPSSMLATVSALAAQNIGAGKHDRASKTLNYAILITFTYGIIVAIIGELITAGIVGIFTKDAAVVVLGSQYLRGYIVDCALAGIHFCFSGYFCAYGKSYIGFIHNMIAIICLRVPGSYLASKFFADTLFPMGLAAPAGSMLSVIICVGAFVWMKKHGRLGDSQIQDAS